MSRPISGKTVVAGVVGSPVRHSLSPIIHNAWLAGAGLDGVYVPFAANPEGFRAFAQGLRGGVVRGLNVTAPFKEEALSLADTASHIAKAAGSANLLLFEANGAILADNTDGEGLLRAFRGQVADFDPTSGPAVILGAGGAARGAAAAFLASGAPAVGFVNRTASRAEVLVDLFGQRTRAFSISDTSSIWEEARIVINATPLGLNGQPGPDFPIERLSPHCIVMDMVYRPLRTRLLEAARARGLRTVDGLEMLIGQAEPSFEAFFGAPPPPVDVRGLALAAMGFEE
jgi:shikimate dehydrogenase